jgi:hypothetical protein
MKKINLLKLAIALYVALDWMGGASFGFMPFSPAAAAQTILTNTTLSAAMPGSQSSSVVLTGSLGIASVASATGISAPTPNSGNTYGPATSEAQSYLFVDRELMEVKGVSGTSITVIRGVGTTATTSHASGALVIVVPAQVLYGNNGRPAAAPAGSCTRANEQFLPRIDFASGMISDCLGGQWVNGDAMQTQRATTVLMNPPTGAVLYTAIETAGTAPSASTEMYCTQINMPFSKLLTGLKVLNGTTVGTDKHLVLLYDAGGNLLANSAAAGVTTAGASTYQAISFTTPYYAVGPASYFGCFTSNGTTDTVRHLITSMDQGLLAGKITGLVFGTQAATIAPPATFTTAVGAYLQLF